MAASSMNSARIPLSTYRLQFNRNFTFKQAAELVPYLAELGISHCYASPYLRARPGSMHGYDIIDHNVLNPEIGTVEDFDAFEVNEAFAPVPLAWAREFGADPKTLNPRGGAIALGHALGSSGTTWG